MLYENFNTTNQTSPHFERHENFVSDAKEPTCALVEFMPPGKRCNYTIKKHQCRDHIYIFNYVNLYYCVLDQSTAMHLFFSIIVLLLLLLLYFTMLRLLADFFFCPALKVLAKILGLNENIAGVTLLAFGNASADMFTNLAGLTSESRRVYSDIYGANLFVLFFVGGLIVFTEPFHIQASGFIRDMLFMFFAAIFIEYVIVSDKIVTLYEGIATVSIYFCYYIVIFTDHYLVKRESRLVEEQMVEEAKYGDYSAVTLRQAKYLRSYGPVEILTKADVAEDGSQMDFRFVNKFDRFYENFNPINPPNQGLFRQFFEAFEEAFDPYDFHQASIFWKIWLIFRTPLMVFYLILMPVVDYDLTMNGWSKLLNCMQIIVSPVFLTFGIKYSKGYLGIPYFVWSLTIMIPLSVYVFVHTRTDKPPKNHDYFAILNILVATFIMYCAAVETYALLTVFGVVTNSSNSFLGCTVLGWGNSIGDLITNLSLSKFGYTRMAFAACIGSPLFNSLMAIGSTFIYKSWRSDTLSYKFVKGTMGGNCFVFHLFLLPSLLFCASCTAYVMRRSIGAMMMTFYLLFFAYCFFGEIEIIHPYGSDHLVDLRFDAVYDF